MIKAFFLLITVSAILPARSQDSAAIVNKAPVIAATESEMQNAISSTESVIKDINNAAPLFERFVIVGPRLWKILKSHPDFKNIKEGNVTLKVPRLNPDGGWTKKDDMQGKLLQEAGEFSRLWSYIKANYDLENARIVDENTRDKFIYWQYFAKMEDPMITIQSSKARFLLKYTKGRLFLIEITSD